MKDFFGISFILALFLLGAQALAQTQDSEQFITSLQVIGADVSAPTVPTNLTATAVSSSQINLSWTASVDNLAVEGYNIFRDNVLIASTSATTYQDTGLLPETLYSYNVSAFDAAGNESARSATATAETLAEVIPQEPGGSPAPGPAIPVIENVQVAMEQTEASITWTTVPLTRSIVRFGLTRDLEGGVIQQVNWLGSHQATLTGLTPETRYFFQIEVETQHGKEARSGILEFVTTAYPDTQAPTNVMDFTAVPRLSDILLSWQNPREPDFDSVRILKSDTFYPTDLFDGELLYEGRAEQFVDADVVAGTTYYYTIFTKDVAGNFSSGASAHARITPVGIDVPPTQEPFIPIDELPVVERPHPDIASLTWLDFDFIQDGELLDKLDGRVYLDGTKNLIVSLDYERVPELLKTIAVALRHPSDPSKVFTFLLRADPEKKTYRAELAPLGESGTFAATIVVVDFKNQALKKLSGALIASLEAFSNQTHSQPFGFVRLCVCLTALGLLLLLPLFLWLLWKRRCRKEDEKKETTPIQTKEKEVPVQFYIKE